MVTLPALSTTSTLTVFSPRTGLGSVTEKLPVGIQTQGDDSEVARLVEGGVAGRAEGHEGDVVDAAVVGDLADEGRVRGGGHRRGWGRSDSRGCAAAVGRGRWGRVVSVYIVVRLTLSTPTSIGPMLFTAAMRMRTCLPGVGRQQRRQIRRNRCSLEIHRVRIAGRGLEDVLEDVGRRDLSVMAKPGAFGFMMSTRTCWSLPSSGFVLSGLL